MISVIIPIYNKSAFINKAINSVLSQSFKSFELIIVNDGSTDNSLEVVEGFNDERIRVINQINSGVSTARNNGVKAAKYNYIAFLDADDWWHKDFLTEMHQLINTYTEACLYASNYYIVKNDNFRKAPLGLAVDFDHGYINYHAVYSKNFCMPINSSCTIIYKPLFERLGGFNAYLKFGEDFDLWFRFSLMGKVAYLNKYLSYYNQDVPFESRAVGGRLWEKENHYIFNLPSIEGHEQHTNIEVKKLLDGLKVRALVRYRVNNLYLNEINQLLREVDFCQQPIYYRFIYNYPLILVKTILALQKKASIVKQYMKQLIK